MNQFFVGSLNTREHPIKRARRKTQAEYITALAYVVKKPSARQDAIKLR